MRYVRGKDTEFQLYNILNGGLGLDNLRGSLVKITTTGGEQQIRHSLGYVPVGWDVKGKNGPVDLWRVRLDDWSNEILYLQSNLTGVEVVLFVN